MSPNGFPQQLDQGADPSASIYDRTAQRYDEYQIDEYTTNYQRRSRQWEDHYTYMRRASQYFLWRHTETYQPCHETTMAIVGPGFDPANRDYDARLVESCLAQLRSIILVDFSTLVHRRAIQSLIDAKVDQERVHPVQIDITNGLSTVYQEYIEDQLRNVGDDETSLASVVERMSKMDVVGELWDRLGRRYEKIAAMRFSKMASIADTVREGLALPSSKRQTLRFTSRGKPIPVNIFSLNMVLAGTGAAADAIFWDRYESAIDTTDSTSPAGVDDTQTRRRKIVTDYHSVITRYNTEVSTAMIKIILEAHPKTRIVATTDFSTNYDSPDITHGDPGVDVIGKLDRIDLSRMKTDLAREGIEVQLDLPPKAWIWEDEPKHSHDVMALMAKRMKQPPQPVSTDTLQAVSAPPKSLPLQVAPPALTEAMQPPVQTP